MVQLLWMLRTEDEVVAFREAKRIVQLTHGGDESICGRSSRLVHFDGVRSSSSANVMKRIVTIWPRNASVRVDMKDSKCEKR